MADKANVLDNSIQLALDAAEAANDAAAELTPLKEGIVASTDQLDTTRRFVIRSVGAALGAATLMLVMAALIYFQTLSNLRTATASQIETMAMLTANMADLDAALVRTAALEDSIAQLEGLETRLESVIDARSTAMRDDILEQLPDITASASEIAEALDAQLAEIVALNADLETALSRLIAAGFDARPPASAAPVATETAPTSAPRSAPAPFAGTPRRTAPRPEPNPFSFP
ncbi:MULTISPECIES: hypothetical protein [Meridianimarinicoccus]|uniref:hypothetical protein n=1 Tax=Meridianimarinicoccus zhengii TaxID=2056810 RepID=UPI0013A6E925|nr:hypothetical protein [Phycocomes zhengii]